ncbi:MAG: hydroxysqualene dehydroxylase HpnE [Burkholderiaceae bacterium]|nr:FAD-dependent oxidoreductase [Burkholderiales bacterium]MCZ8340059.1 hydroxysqualene dehydroxylase HpnE [Burkholderiaceae bacterium]
MSATAAHRPVHEAIDEPGTGRGAVTTGGGDTDVLVVGAGWAGLAAAVGLVEAGRATTVIDAAPQAGGRARALTLELDGERVEVDNGQHLLIGAYRSTLALVARVGADPDAALARSRLRLSGPGGFELRAAPLPAPLNLGVGLLRARGFPWPERIAMVRAMAGLARRGPASVRDGETVAGWLAAQRQPPALVDRLWTPLCIGALNTPIERACARAFAQVLCDALLARASDADFLLPRGTLGDVLPEPALAWLRGRGATVRLRTACRALSREADGRWRADTAAGSVRARAVVLAVPPPQVARLLDGAVPAARLAPFDAFEHEPIATVWLAWQERLALPEATMLAERAGAGEHGQWLFGRRSPAGGGIGAVAGVVVSAAGRLTERPVELADGVARQVAAQLGLPRARHARAIIERRATIRCSPDRPRLDTDALADVAPGLALAGDWSWHRYPATIESAVRSGDAAARHLVTGVAPRA